MMTQTKTALMISTQVCPHCARAKAMLTEHNYQIIEIKAGENIPMESVFHLSGRSSVPQIFIAGQHIGGADDLETWLKNKT